MRAGFDYRAVVALSALAGMYALPGLRSRRLARSGVSLRGASGLDFGRGQPPTFPLPPAPPNDRTRPAGDMPGRSGGRAPENFWSGEWGQRRKPVEIVVTNLQTHVAVRTPPPRVTVKHPRVGVFFPRVALFFPRVRFCVFSRFDLLFSLFSLEKERERRVGKGKTRIHGFENSANTHSTGMVLFPRVFRGRFFEQKPMLARVCGVFGRHPRVHGSKCLYAPHGGSQ